MAKFRNKYRIESVRLKEWDYSTPWWYYVTINIKGHKEYFGKMCSNNVELNEIGKICFKCWTEIPVHYPSVELDYFVIMPNHLHGILILNDKQKNTSVETGYIPSLQRGGVQSQQQRNIPSLLQRGEVQSRQLRNSPSKRDNRGNPTLGDIIGKFKAAVTRKVSEMGYKDFQWQRRFYDRIIRNDKELFFIRKYINDNPLKWELEKNSPENLGI